MPRFSQQFIQQVAQATDIVELVGRYVTLKKRGKEFVGLYPFHDDNRPSLNVSPTKQIFKCFACGAGGGVFQFLMRYEKHSFPEAVRVLAEAANIPLPQDSFQLQADEGPTRKDLLKVTQFAARFFRSRLNSPAGKAALDYARKRGLSDESIRRFGLGCSADSWDALLAAARKKGITEQRLLAAGLVIRGEAGRCYDRFRNRLMFPIIDPAGAVIAFGGRALAEQERAKYINSPDSVLFDKSANLYALNWAREAVSSSGQAIVVEGYLDALIPHQAGVDNVLATLGTALTDRHVRLLARYAREVVLIFDADTAGATAAERAMEIFLAQQVNVRVATIPAGKDPCDFCLAEGPDALRAAVADAPDALQHIWQRRQEQLTAAGSSLADRRRVIEDFLRIVASSQTYGAIDEVRRGQLAQHIAHMLNIPAADLQQQMRRLTRRVRRPKARQVGRGQSPPPPQPVIRAERHVLEVLLNEPDLFDAAAERISPADFTDQDFRAIATCVWTTAQSGEIAVEDLLAREELADMGALLTELAGAGERRGNYQETLSGAVDLMVYHREHDEMRKLKADGLSDETLREIHHRREADVRRVPRIS